MAVSLVPVPSEQDRASCPNCSAALAPDQRYCLACGQPVSSVRLAFLDVLQSDSQPYAAGQGPAGFVAPGYATVIEPASGIAGRMRRYSGLFGLLAVLLMAIIVGLLVGHWVTQSKTHRPAGGEGRGSERRRCARGRCEHDPGEHDHGDHHSPAGRREQDERQDRSQGSHGSQGDRKSTHSESGQSELRPDSRNSATRTGKQHEEEVNKLGRPADRNGRGLDVDAERALISGGHHRRSWARAPPRAWSCPSAASSLRADRWPSCVAAAMSWPSASPR